MIDGSVLQSAQRCFEKKSRVVVKMVVMALTRSQQKSWAKHIPVMWLYPPCKS